MRLTNRQFLLRKLQMLLSDFDIPHPSDDATLRDLKQLHQVTGALIEAFSKPAKPAFDLEALEPPARDFVSIWIDPLR